MTSATSDGSVAKNILAAITSGEVCAFATTCGVSRIFCNTTLHEWVTRIAARQGKATAAVALARKLAGILFALWRDGTEFDPGHGLAAAGS